MKIPIECPDCHNRCFITVPSLKEEGLTNITITQGICCDHSFTVSIDTNGAVRFYGKVIYEVNKKSQKKAEKEEKKREKYEKALEKAGLPKDYKEPSPEDKLRSIL